MEQLRKQLRLPPLAVAANANSGKRKGIFQDEEVEVPQRKKTVPLQYKAAVVKYCAEKNKSSRQVAQELGLDSGNVRAWIRNRRNIHSTLAECKHKRMRKRCKGGGRKTKLADLEHRLCSFVLIRRNLTHQRTVLSSTVREEALRLASNARIRGFKASFSWLYGFYERYHFSIRRRTNLVALEAEDLVERSVKYMQYFQSQVVRKVPLDNCVFMDETRCQCDDPHGRTVDSKGAKKVYVRATGSESLATTAILAVNGKGKKLIPTIIHRSTSTVCLHRVNTPAGDVLEASNPKAWTNQFVTTSWLDTIFSSSDIDQGRPKCIIMDACRAHTAESVKQYCRERGIIMCIIPGGITSLVQPGDLGYYKSFKKHLADSFNIWKRNDSRKITNLTARGNVRPPKPDVINRWVCESWLKVPHDSLHKSLNAAGLSRDYNEWHISRNPEYGELFKQGWVRTLQPTTRCTSNLCDFYADDTEEDDDIEDDLAVQNKNDVFDLPSDTEEEIEEEDMGSSDEYDSESEDVLSLEDSCEGYQTECSSDDGEGADLVDNQQYPQSDIFHYLNLSSPRSATSAIESSSSSSQQLTNTSKPATTAVKTFSLATFKSTRMATASSNRHESGHEPSLSISILPPTPLSSAASRPAPPSNSRSVPTSTPTTYPTDSASARSMLTPTPTAEVSRRPSGLSTTVTPDTVSSTRIPTSKISTSIAAQSQSAATSRHTQNAPSSMPPPPCQRTHATTTSSHVSLTSDNPTLGSHRALSTAKPPTKVVTTAKPLPNPPPPRTVPPRLSFSSRESENEDDSTDSGDEGYRAGWPFSRKASSVSKTNFDEDEDDLMDKNPVRKQKRKRVHC